MTPLVLLSEFVSTARPPSAARRAAAAAFLDTIGVTLAGNSEPASRIVAQTVAASNSPDGASHADGPCVVWGTSMRTSATDAALANGTAAHALDYDDMCFVSMAHPSAPLVPAAIAVGELVSASGSALLDAYVVGFEIECRLGALMNPRHYHRGWHCTSTLGTIGAAAAASRLLGLSAMQIGHALAIAASEASGLKENFGTMVKPLHAGLAARNGVLAAQFARGGLTASAHAFEGTQGFLAAFDSSGVSLGDAVADLGTRWEIVDTGITVKLYPSCAGTHPTIDALLDLRRLHGLSANDIDTIRVGVDKTTPTVLIHARPATGLEAKFSMPFCAAAAIAHGRVDIDTFEANGLADPLVRALMPRVSMQVDDTLDPAAPALTQARVTITCRDGRAFTRAANGARGYPANPASGDELDAKFTNCAERAVSRDVATRALAMLRAIEDLEDVRELTRALVKV